MIIMMGYAVIKGVLCQPEARRHPAHTDCRGQPVYVFRSPRLHRRFTQWCKQIIGLCLTTFLQATILAAGLMVLRTTLLLGLGLMLAAGEVPRIAGAFGLDTSTKPT
jgi:hypothetical protein